ncbi:MAG: response regulator, partial [Novosphingobium sp.]
MLERLSQDEVLRAIPTIVVSVDDRRRLSIEKGASEHLVKPVDVDELDSVLQLYSRQRKGKVLLVEDDMATGQLYENGLRQSGYEIVRAHNGEDALQALAGAHFSLVVTDLMMPRADGFALIRRIAALPAGERPPVVVVTSRILSSEERQFLDTSADAVCFKSGLTPRGLVSAVSDILHA